MIHPSYVDLMEVVNKDVEEGETPVINSRYSIVMATAKRARQIVDGDEPLVKVSRGEKPLSTAVAELNQGVIRILAEDEVEEDYIEGEETDEDAQMIGEEEIGAVAEAAETADDAAAEAPAEEAEAGEDSAEPEEEKEAGEEVE